MTKNWEILKQDILTLYLEEGQTLQDVRKAMKVGHDFGASTRAYRMKLVEWGIRKNKTKHISRDSKFRGIRDGIQLSPPTPEVSSPGRDALPSNPDSNGPLTSSVEISSFSGSSRTPPPVTPHSWDSPNIQFAIHPLVDLSLHFLLTRYDSESLEILAKSFSLSARESALEILLNNWKPGGGIYELCENSTT